VNRPGGYLATAFAGGLAALSQALSLSGEQRFAYRAQWLLFLRLRATREHLKNRLDHPASLRVRRSGRGLEECDSVLPEPVGRNGCNEGKTWKLDRLLDEGRAEAQEQGVSRPSGMDCVRYGLLRAARRDPLRPQAGEVPGLIRMALYESPSGRKADPETTGRVIERALEAVRPHLADGTNAFDRWFRGAKNSFVDQIAKRQQAPGGKLMPAVVRQVLSDQGWLAYQHVADCVHTALYLFRRLHPVPLSEAEGRAFERVHLKQDYFGGLPSLMLAERFPQLWSILTDVWEEVDNREAVAVMHRLLYYYSEMASTRRVADRLAKARKAGTRNKKPDRPGVWGGCFQQR
jgi:hypothetical protein